MDNKEVLASLLKLPFTQQVHVSVKLSPEKGISSTVTALATVEDRDLIMATVGALQYR